MSYLRRERVVIVLLLAWALLVALRNTVFHTFELGWWFLLVLGAVAVFQAGQVHERARK